MPPSLRVSDWAAGDDIGAGRDVLPAGGDERGGLLVEVLGTIDRTGEFDALALGELVLGEEDGMGTHGTQGASLALVGRTIVTVTVTQPTGGVQ